MVNPPSTNRATYEIHDPQSLTPAPGWRAAYLIDDPPGWFAEPLVCLAVCHVTTHPCVGSTARGRDEGRQVHGYVNTDYICCAEEVSNFWRYIAPEEPDPSNDEAREEHKRHFRSGKSRQAS